jgi:predicted O-linked N-acetylglucosamine transferase (SPINDLY family)
MQTVWREFSSKNNFEAASEFFANQIEQLQTSTLPYCYLGLSFLLREREEEAQMTWFMGSDSSDSTDSFEIELNQVILEEIAFREGITDYQNALLLRQHLRQIDPFNLDNLVQIVFLSLQLKVLTLENLYELNIVEIIGELQTIDDSTVEENTLFQLIQNVLYSPLSHEYSIGYISLIIPYIKNIDGCLELLLYIASKSQLIPSLNLFDLCLSVKPDSISVLGAITQAYMNHAQCYKAIKIAKQIVFSSSTIGEKIYTNYLLMSSLMNSGGNWEEAKTSSLNCKSLVNLFADQQPLELPIHYLSYLALSPFFAPYFNDLPKENRELQNKALTLFQANIYASNQKNIESYSSNHQSRKGIKKDKIRIGYLSVSLRQHSIGWLARSLFQHHDREKFEIFGYFPESAPKEDILQKWYISRMDKVFKDDGNEFGFNPLLIADEIQRDQIDILVDLESITSGICTNLLSRKLAPIQVTWLGWDASGLPAIDYFIADPYVLPENAQDYYSEKIWRLPETFIAVDGFNCSLASINRDDLGIPSDAIVYLSAQKCFKRHPDTVLAQLQIISMVPNSYFLIKGLADEGTIQSTFWELAQQVDVDYTRLIFLQDTKTEAEHRANMAIADIVLDTYPYNGATTTMETLWMGIPMVTQVGEQFSARNSYTMMINAGITEGIAWNVAEYIEWGVRFGTDEDLRKEVSWKLRQSRKTSPLWDGRKFAREMENTYTSMWEIYNG